MEKEQKDIVLPFELKAVGEPDDKGYVEFEGYAAAFDNKDLGDDIIIKGAFADTIKDDVNWPIFRDHYASIEDTVGFNLSAKEDNFGLLIRGQINTNVEAGKTVYHLAKQALELGKQIGLSIGYGIVEKETDPDTYVRTLKKLKMYEYSFTNFPMNPKATATALKDKQRQMIKSVLTELLEEKGLIEKEGDDETDERSEQEEKELINEITAITEEVRQWTP